MPRRTEAPPVDVIGGRFPDLVSAVTAREAILAAVAVPAADVAVQPLGSTQYDDGIESFVLAGRFPSDSGEAVVRLIREHGGIILAHRSESPSSTLPAKGGPARRPPASRGTLARLGSARPSASRLKRPRRPARFRSRTARDGRLCA